MEFKFTLIFGIVLAIIVLAVANAVWMLDPGYASPAAIVTIIIFTLIFTKLYLGKVSSTMKDMVVTSIVWIIIVAVIEAIVAFAMGMDIAAYYSNYMIYVGYILIIIFAIIGFKLFGGAGGTQIKKPAASPAKPATPPAV